MAVYSLNDRVEVRGNRSHAWRAGAVTNANAQNGAAYEVTLDTPINANTWSGTTRKYAGSEMLSKVFINKSVETMSCLEGEHIRAEPA